MGIVSGVSEAMRLTPAAIWRVMVAYRRVERPERRMAGADAFLATFGSIIGEGGEI